MMALAAAANVSSTTIFSGEEEVEVRVQGEVFTTSHPILMTDGNATTELVAGEADIADPKYNALQV